MFQTTIYQVDLKKKISDTCHRVNDACFWQLSPTLQLFLEESLAVRSGLMWPSIPALSSPVFSWQITIEIHF